MTLYNWWLVLSQLFVRTGKQETECCAHHFVNGSCPAVSARRRIRHVTLYSTHSKTSRDSAWCKRCAGLSYLDTVHGACTKCLDTVHRAGTKYINSAWCMQAVICPLE